MRPTWVWGPCAFSEGRQWLALGGAAEKGFRLVDPKPVSYFLLSVLRSLSLSFSLAAVRGCLQLY